MFCFFFPVNPDEAYYILWSNNLSLGYYDHPPMIAWLIKVVSYIDIDIPKCKVDINFILFCIIILCILF